MRPFPKAAVQLAGFAFVSMAVAAGEDGLKVRSDDAVWSRWQARLLLGTAAPAWRSNLKDLEPSGLRISSISMVGDYYLSSSLFERSLGGLRASSGLIVGPRSQATAGQPSLGAQGSGFATERRLLGSVTTSVAADATTDIASVPYVGLGYTGLSLRAGWSFSADLGVVALYPGNATRLGRVSGGTRSFDDVMRDLRWAPVLQMGVSYAF